MARLNRRKHTYIVPNGPVPTQITQSLVDRARGPQDEPGRVHGEAQRAARDLPDLVGGPRKPLKKKKRSNFMAGRALMRGAKRNNDGDNSPVSTGGY